MTNVVELYFDANDGFEYDTGHEIMPCDLQIELEPIVEDCSFQAYNEAGFLQTYGGLALTGYKLIGGTIFVIGHDGQVIEEIEIEDQKQLDALGLNKDELMDLIYEEIEDEL